MRGELFGLLVLAVLFPIYFYIINQLHSRSSFITELPQKESFGSFSGRGRSKEGGGEAGGLPG